MRHRASSRKLADRGLWARLPGTVAGIRRRKALTTLGKQTGSMNLESLEARQMLAADLVINEIHYDSFNKTEHVEFIELYNAGDQAAELTGWNLANAIDYAFPTGTSVAPDAYLVVSQNPEALKAKFDADSIGPLDRQAEQPG